MIAISYRREDSLPIAGRLYDRLQAKFGKKNVFMDFDSIPPGMDFREQIKRMIERSNLVIAIIGPQWLGEQPDASRRIDNPADFVRLEIAYALKRGIPVIPVLVNNTAMPSPDKLPQEIEGLSFRNAVTLDTGIDFNHHADRLITGIRKAMDAAPSWGGPQKVPQPTAFAANTRPWRKIVTWSAAILLAVVASALVARGVATRWRVPTKQVATQEESNRASAESATSTILVNPPVEHSSPPQMASAQPNSIVEQSSEPQITEAPRPGFASITKERPYVNSLGMKFVPVPGTTVLFSIWETRVKDFEAFVEATNYDVAGEMYAVDDHGEWATGRTWKDPGFAQTGEHAVCGVSWQDATAFCNWLTEQERKAGRINPAKSYRLPSDEEWSAAVGLEKESGSTPEERNRKVKGVYPWGTKVPPPAGAGNYAGSEARTGGWKSDWIPIDGYRDAYPRTAPVGSFEANRYGIYDLGGNVWEWCQDWFNAEHKFRVLRGAAWVQSSPGLLLSSCRFANLPESRFDTRGFRCVLSESKIVSPAVPANTIPNVEQGAEKLVRVHIKKYGLSAVIPLSTFPDAQKLSTSDLNSLRSNSWSGQTTVTFDSVNQPLAKVYADYSAEHSANAPDRTVDYKVLKPTWFVVSGDLGAVSGVNMGFYIKGVKKGGEVVIMRLEYREDDFPFSNETFTAMSRGFDGK